MSTLLFLVPAFFVTALLYAAVGFGGGSTYNALLVLTETDYRVLPTIALICNVAVVTGGAWRFAQAGHVHLQRIAPWLITSIPTAWLGGRIPVPETLFVGLLGFALLAAGIHMLLPRPARRVSITARAEVLVALAVGALLGLLAGVVGIGGGIFLAPVLYLLERDTPRRIAAACSVFILVNSLAGLTGQLMKLGLGNTGMLAEAVAYWPVVPAVLLGGQIGSWMGAKHIDPRVLTRMTALLILYVAVRLLWRWGGMVGE